jgi:predicted ATP-grasp superfamily ATP-dependent carboligase
MWKFRPTWSCSTEFEVQQITREPAFPLVLKPRRSIYSIGNAVIHKTAIFAFSPEDLRRKFSAILSETGEAPLIQKLIRGEEAGVEFLCDRGSVLAVCAHRRIRSFPPSGGPAVVKETVPLSYHGLGERAERIVRELNWSCPIMVEFKMDNETAAPRLMG